MTLSVLSSNLPFVVSLLWLLYHTVMFTIPLMWTFAFATARPGSSPPAGAPGGFTVGPPTRTAGTPGPVDSPRTVTVADSKARGSPGCLGMYSYIAWALCWAAVLLVAIACLGMGDDTSRNRESDYSSLLSNSLQFYQVQQSGKLSNNPISWRGNSGLTDLPLGGWYEGGSECFCKYSAILLCLTTPCYTMLHSICMSICLCHRLFLLTFTASLLRSCQPCIAWHFLDVPSFCTRGHLRMFHANSPKLAVSDVGLLRLCTICSRELHLCIPLPWSPQCLPGVAIIGWYACLYPLLSNVQCGMHAGNLKLTFPIAIAATQLAWGMIAAPGGFAGSPSTAAHLASLKWGTDYLMACRPSPTEFVAQARKALCMCQKVLHVRHGNPHVKFCFTC